jgi:hypothetical protein
MKTLDPKYHEIIILFMRLFTAILISYLLLLLGLDLGQDRLGFAASNKSANPILSWLTIALAFIIFVNPIFNWFKPNTTLYRAILFSGLAAIPILLMISM